MAKTISCVEKIAKRLEIGDKVLSATGKKLKVTKLIFKENRTIVLFDEDMEVDFDPFFRFQVIEKK